MTSEVVKQTGGGAVAGAVASNLIRKLHLEDNEGNWLPPAMFTEQEKAQARAILADMPRRMKPASSETIAKWLASLGVLCAGKMSLDDAQVKIAAYVSVLLDDFEAGCYTDVTLKRVFPQFTWFPSAGELHAALKLEKRRLYVERARLQRVVDGVDRRGKEREPPTQEQQDKVTALIRELDAVPGPTVGRAPAPRSEVSRETPASAAAPPPSTDNQDAAQ